MVKNSKKQDWISVLDREAKNFSYSSGFQNHSNFSILRHCPIFLFFRQFIQRIPHGKIKKVYYTMPTSKSKIYLHLSNQIEQYNVRKVNSFFNKLKNIGDEGK